MSFDRESILRKVRGLANLADPSRNPNEHQVKEAARKMQELMDQYNISMLDVMNEENVNAVSFTEKTCEGLLGQAKAWHWGLARVIARITSTKTFATGGYGQTLREKHSGTKGNHRGYRMTFFGAKGSVEFACELYDQWVVTIDRMSVDATSAFIKERMEDEEVIEEMRFQDVKQYRHLQGLGSNHPNVYRNSWLLGVIFGINEALTEQEATRRTTIATTLTVTTPSEHKKEEVPVTVSTALAILHTQIEEAYRERSRSFTSSSSHSSASSNYSAMNRGKAVGRTINLTAKKLKG